jgi:hypothetical protein
MEKPLAVNNSLGIFWNQQTLQPRLTCGCAPRVLGLQTRVVDLQRSSLQTRSQTTRWTRPLLRNRRSSTASDAVQQARFLDRPTDASDAPSTDVVPRLTLRKPIASLSAKPTDADVSVVA